MGNAGSKPAYVFAGGDPPDPSVLAELPEPHIVIAADSGLHHAIALGQVVDLVVGDLDSADPGALEFAETSGATIERHPVAKNATDLELALRAARDRGCERVFVLGGDGGRIDHFFANALLLASSEFASLQVHARMGSATVLVVHDSSELHGAVGDLCTLLPVGGAAHGVVTEGLRYPLRSETLHSGTTRGMSNELVEPLARVSLTGGVLLAILPDARRTRS